MMAAAEYKLLIVDDEEFEREGLAQLIHWEKYGVQVVGTARNGLEGLKKAGELRPDIVLTDIKMPAMNGVEMIRALHEKYPEMEFAVLSGYGDYEFTSQAMELGVRHYVLKPCGESKIADVIEKVKADVEKKRQAVRREEEYLYRIAPQARKQLFRDLLLERAGGSIENLFHLSEKGLPRNVRLPLFRSTRPFDSLEEFALDNIMEELLDTQKQVLFVSAAIDQDVALLISDINVERLSPIVRRVRQELKRVKREPVRAAVSDSGQPDMLAKLYIQADSLLETREALSGDPVLHSGILRKKKEDIDRLADFELLNRTREYPAILQSLQLTFLRMQKRGFSMEEKREMADRLLKRMFGCTVPAGNWDSPPELMIYIAQQIWERITSAEESRDEFRYRAILEEIYRNFQEPDFSLKVLASKALYMNQDYIGRLFQKMSGKRFTSFLLEIRMDAAQKLIVLEPDITVSALSSFVGYASDGHYFSKCFKKYSGMTPSEYRERLQEENSEES